MRGRAVGRGPRKRPQVPEVARAEPPRVRTGQTRRLCAAFANLANFPA